MEQGATLISVVLPTSIDCQVATDADYHYAGITSGVGDVANNSKTGEGADVAVKISLVAVNDQNNLTNLMRLGLAPSNKESVALEQPYLLNGFNAENPQEIFSSLAGGATSDLTVFGGKASGAQNPNIPDGDYTIVTTVKVEAITTPAT